MLTRQEYTHQTPVTKDFSPVLKAVAFLFSFVFHPVFIPIMAVAFLAFVQHGYYTGIPEKEKMMIIARVGVNTLFFPLITVLLLKGLGFIKSIFLKERKDRIIPYVATNIFYFWMFLVFLNQADVPRITTSFVLGIFIASSLGLILNSFFKISMHALGMGSFTGLLLLIIFTGYPAGIFLSLMAILLLSGIVCTSRLILSDHSIFDTNAGFLLGIATQFIGGLFIGT